MRGRTPRAGYVGWLLVMVGAMVLGALLPLARVAAQDATPDASIAASPTAGEVIKSPTREEMRAEIEAAFPIEEAQNQGGTFIDSGTSDIQTLNPLLAEESATFAVLGQIYEQLVGGDPRTGQPAPTGLADRWEIAPDGITYTFYLNKEAKWHDGTDVTADDVIFSFDAQADEATASTYTTGFNNAVASYRAIDEDTIEVVAKDRLVSFLYELVSWVVPKHVWENVPHEAWKEDPASTGQDPARVIGSGPFKLQEWKQGESVTLVRNDDYYDVMPHIDSYVYRVWPNQEAIVNALLNGEVDLAGLEPADVAAVEGAEGVKIETYSTQSFVYFEYNLNPETTTKWQDARVRQALVYALDREAIVNDILLGYAEVARGTQPTISYAYDPESIETEYTYDPEKAKQLLADAGWTDTNGNGIVDKDGEELEFEFLYPSGSPTYDQMVAYFQDAWREIGVAMTPRSLEFTALIEATTTEPTFEVALYGFNWDATFIQDAMFGCDQYQTGFNDMKYCNLELDEIHEQARREFDDERRAEVLIQASNIVNEELPVVVIYFSQAIVAYSARLHNVFPGPWSTLGPGLSYVWIEE